MRKSWLCCVRIPVSSFANYSASLDQLSSLAVYMQPSQEDPSQMPIQMPSQMLSSSYCISILPLLTAIFNAMVRSHSAVASKRLECVSGRCQLWPPSVRLHFSYTVTAFRSQPGAPASRPCRVARAHSTSTESYTTGAERSDDTSTTYMSIIMTK